MCSPKPIDFLFDVLQVRTTDRQLFTVFQDSHSVFDLHDLDDIDDITAVDIDEFRRVNFLEYLLQTFPDFRGSVC